MNTFKTTTCAAIMQQFWIAKSLSKKTLHTITIDVCNGLKEDPDIYLQAFAVEVPVKSYLKEEETVIYRLFTTLRQYYNKEKAQLLLDALNKTEYVNQWHNVGESSTPSALRLIAKIKEINGKFQHQVTEQGLQISIQLI